MVSARLHSTMAVVSSTGRSESAVLAAIESAARRMGYKHKPRHEEAVSKFLLGRDIFVSLPTGSGKTWCYSVLPWASDILRERLNCSIIVVVSPLVALMKDQVAIFTAKGNQCSQHYRSIR